MKVLCISCSNIEVAREHSASTRACELVGDLLREESLPGLEIEVLPLPYYQNALLDPLAGALASVGMRPIGGGEGWPNGVNFGIKSLAKWPDSIFVDIHHDWMEVRERIQPLVSNVLTEVRLR